MEAMGEFVDEGFKVGWLKDTGGLKASEHGHRLRLSGGKLKVLTDPSPSPRRSSEVTRWSR
jgi:hypothetical protein